MTKGRTGRPWRRLVMLAKQELPHVCHLCEAPIDVTLHHLDDMSWTLDHLHPLAHGGAPEDLGNVLPAHRICNLRKGARTDYTPPPKPKGSRVW